MRHVTGILALGVVLATPAGVAVAEPVTRARMDRLESGCVSGCLENSGDHRYCKAYCACVKREVSTGRSEAAVDALYAVMRPDAPDGPAKKALHRLMDGCVAEADAPTSR